MTYAFSDRSKDRMVGVDQRLIAVANLALQISPIDFGIPQHGGLRTAEEQRELWERKLSQLDGHKHKSYHQSGKALDFYAYVNGRASWDQKHMAIVAASFLQAGCALGYKLQWGGLWKNYKDFPHVQLVE